jgi:pimeloyl-ACP methyl ester carboxylesterase
MSAVQITDHQGNKVFHGRVLANGVRLHYITAGSGAPLLLLHGVPKTSFYWYRTIPLLTPHFTIVAPDIRGFGDSVKPHGGYDMKTIAEDLAQLMSALGHDTFSVAGEDWGAAFAYALAASKRDRVKKLSFGEMLLPGFGIEKWSDRSMGGKQTRNTGPCYQQRVLHESRAFAPDATSRTTGRVC